MSVVLLRWAVLFLVLALMSAAFALSGLSADWFWMARIGFLVFLVGFVVTAAASSVAR